MHGPYVPVEPAELVEVEYEGVWYRGRLEGWRRYDHGWMAYVNYERAVGMTYVAWVLAGRVRPRDSSSGVDVNPDAAEPPTPDSREVGGSCDGSSRAPRSAPVPR